MKTISTPLFGPVAEMCVFLGALLLFCPTASAQFPGGDGGGFRGFGGRTGNGNNNATEQNEVRQAAQQVTAVADEYSNSLIILAPEIHQDAISNLVAQLDVAIQDITELRVFTLKNADPTEMAEVLNGLFEDQTSNTQNTGRGPGFFFGGRGGNNTVSDESDRSKQQSTVVAVPDPRTSSILVSASKNLMAQIDPMIEELDANTSKKQKVFVYSLENANSTEVETVLRNLFETQNTRNNRTSSTQNNQQNNALQQRQSNTARNQGTTLNSGLGGGGLGGGTGFGSGN